MSKPVIFISGYCEYCKELMTNLMKNNMQSKFDYVNVDEGQDIPQFVDRIPLMYFDKKVLVDEGLFDYIEGLKKKLMQANQTEIKPFLSGEMTSNSISDSYSYIGEENSADKKQIVHSTFDKNYSHIGMEHQKIYTPEDNDAKDKSRCSLEELISRREHDIKFN